MRGSILLEKRLEILCLIFASSIILSVSCRNVKLKGHLHVSAPGSGTYELYSVAGDSSVQFVSEHVGHYNQVLDLAPGKYLVLADCSHRQVDVVAGQRLDLVAHLVEFLPPHPPLPGDLFSIQCSRSDGSHLKQQINNRYSFHMISGINDLLVGMLPLKIDFGSSAAKQESQTIKFDLSALQVTPWQKEKAHFSLYFVSSFSELLSITQPQVFGKWQFLLPSKYVVHVNGTERLVELAPKESKTIRPAGIEVKTEKSLDLASFVKIKGNPFAIELNRNHSLELNRFYPVLPGKASLRFDGSFKQHRVELAENQICEVNLKSLSLDLGCSPWEWECLGRHEVNLYLPGQDYPFLDSLSDMPILYNEEAIEVGLENSKGIRYSVPSSKSHVRLQVGRLKIVPKPTFAQGLMTDLLRLETRDPGFVGHSHDIAPDQETTMLLIAGTYALSRYTNIGQDSERIIKKYRVQVVPGELTELEIPYFLSEKNARQKAEQMESRKGQHEKTEKNRLRKLRPIGFS